MDEEPVVAVRRGIAQRLARHRQHTSPLFAGGFGDQLLEPQSDARERGRQHERQLVAPLRVRVADHASEGLARVDAELVMAFRERGAGAVEHRPDVDAREHGGHQAERRQRRVAAADVATPVCDARPAVPARALLERRAGIRDRDEARAVAAGLGPERVGEAVGLDRRARLRRDGEQRAIDRHGAHGVGIGRIEHVQPVAVMELADHERSEARAAHAAENGALVARAQRPRPGLQLGKPALRLADGIDPAQPLVLAGARPERGVAREQPRDLCSLVHALAGASACAFSSMVAIRESNDLANDSTPSSTSS